MSSYWLAQELARRDGDLVGFWPLQGNLLDHSGRMGHLSPVQLSEGRVMVPVGDINAGGWVNPNGTSFPIYSFVNRGLDAQPPGTGPIVLANSAGSTLQLRFPGLVSNPVSLTVRFIISSEDDFNLNATPFTLNSISVFDRNGIPVGTWNGSTSAIPTYVIQPQWSYAEFSLSIHTENAGIWDLSFTSLQFFILSSSGPSPSISAKILALDILQDATELPVARPAFVSQSGRSGCLLPDSAQKYLVASRSPTNDWPVAINSKFSLACWYLRSVDLSDSVDGVVTGYTGFGLISTTSIIPTPVEIDDFAGFELCTNANGQIVFRLVASYVNGQYLEVATVQQVVFSDNEIWKHVAMTYDGNMDGTGLKLIIDGESVPVTVAHNGLTSNANVGGQIVLGAARRGLDEMMTLNGNLACVRVYKRGLSEADVDRIYRRELQLPAIRTRKRVGPEVQNPITLFMRAFDSPTPLGATLYMRSDNGTLSNQTTLFLSGVNSGNANMLGSIPLFAKGLDQKSKGMTLFIGDRGNPVPVMPLFLQGEGVARPLSPVSMQGPVAPLFIFGSANPNFMIGGNPASGNMGLFLKGDNFGNRSTNMNLWTKGEYRSASRGLPLFLLNAGLGSGIPLFITGDGLNPGAHPFSGNVNLFLNRGTAAGFSLFTHGPGNPKSNGIPLFMSTANAPPNGTMPMVLPDVHGSQTQKATLYTHGF